MRGARIKNILLFWFCFGYRKRRKRTQSIFYHYAVLMVNDGKKKLEKLKPNPIKDSKKEKSVRKIRENLKV